MLGALLHRRRQSFPEHRELSHGQRARLKAPRRAHFHAPRGLCPTAFEPLVIAVKRRVMPLNCMTPIDCSILTALSSAFPFLSNALSRSSSGLENAF